MKDKSLTHNHRENQKRDRKKKHMHNIQKTFSEITRPSSPQEI